MNFLVKITKTRLGWLDFGSPFNEARWKDFCQKNEGKYVRIEKPIPTRTLTQNAFYWAWLTKVEIETGTEKDELHEFLKQMFLPKRVIKIRGKKNIHELEVCGSTTKLNKHEFGEYLDRSSAYVGIPLPTEEEILELGYLRN